MKQSNILKLSRFKELCDLAIDRYKYLYGQKRLHSAAQIFVRTSSQFVLFLTGQLFCTAIRTIICVDRQVPCQRRPYPYKNLYGQKLVLHCVNGDLNIKILILSLKIFHISIISKTLQLCAIETCETEVS